MGQADREEKKGPAGRGKRHLWPTNLEIVIESPTLLTRKFLQGSRKKDSETKTRQVRLKEKFIDSCETIDQGFPPQGVMQTARKLT